MKYFIILLFIIFSSFGLTINNPNDTLSVYSWRYHKNSINGFQTVGELNNIRTSNLGKPCNVQLIDTFVINATTIIDSNMVLDVMGRGYFKKGTGDSLIINGKIGNVPNKQWLDTALPIRFASGVVEKMRPEWWGAKGDGVTDDTKAIQLCANSITQTTIGRYDDFLPDSVDAGNAHILSTSFYFRANGKYKISTGITFGNYKIWSENAYIFSTDTSIKLITIPGFYNEIEGLTFNGGKYHIWISGPRVNASNTVIKRCYFRNAKTRAIMTDRSGFVNSGYPMELLISDCKSTGSPFLHANTDGTIIENTWISWTSDTSRDGDSGSCIIASGPLSLNNVLGVPDNNSVGKPWIESEDGTRPSDLIYVRAKNFRMGGEDARTPIFELHGGYCRGSTFSFDDCDIQSISSTYWGILHSYPRLISFNNCSYSNAVNTRGLFLSDSLSYSGFLANTKIKFDEMSASLGSKIVYRGSNYLDTAYKFSNILPLENNPVITELSLPNYLTTATSSLFTSGTGWTSSSYGSITALTNDTSLGYAMSVNYSDSLSGVSKLLTNSFIADTQGTYTFSFWVKSSDRTACFFYDKSSDTTKCIKIQEVSPGLNRLSCSYYNDGVIGNKIGWTIPLCDSGTLFFGLPAINKGNIVGAWRPHGYAESHVNSIHYGKIVPTTGTWYLGDIVFNTSPGAYGPIGWQCITAGSPGSWISIGQQIWDGTTLNAVNRDTTNSHYVASISEKFEQANTRMQLLSSGTGSSGSAQLFTYVPATGNNKHWFLHHSGPTQLNTFRIGYASTTATGFSLFNDSYTKLSIDTLGRVKIFDTTSSTSSTTGALVVSGGVAAKTFYGDTLNVYSWRYHGNSINGFQTVGELSTIRTSNLGKPCNVQLIDTFVINATTIIDSNMVLDVMGRGYFKKGTGDSLIINGKIGNVPNKQWLDTALPVRFAAGAVESVRPEWFGWVAGGVVDNSKNFARCINSAAGNKVVIPSGTYLLSNIARYAFTQDINIQGAGKNSTILLGNDTIGFVITTDYKNINVRDCQFRNFQTAFYTGGSASVKIGKVDIHYNRFVDCDKGPILLGGDFTKDCDITHNDIDSCMGYVGGGVIAIRLGGESPNTQPLMGNYNVSFNNISNIVSGGTDREDCIGIMLLGFNATIIGNHLTNIHNADYSSGSEAIYTKCQYAIISKNIIKDAGYQQAAITIKGQPHNADTTVVTSDKGHSVLCEGNQIYWDSTKVDFDTVRVGIYVKNESVCLDNNLIENPTYGIYTDEAQDSGIIDIVNNRIWKPNNSGIRLYNYNGKVNISGNKIYCPIGKGVTTLIGGIYYRNDDSSSVVTIKDNYVSIDKTCQASITMKAIDVNPETDSGGIKQLIVSGNTIEIDRDTLSKIGIGINSLECRDFSILNNNMRIVGDGTNTPISIDDSIRPIKYAIINNTLVNDESNEKGFKGHAQYVYDYRDDPNGTVIIGTIPPHAIVTKSYYNVEERPVRANMAAKLNMGIFGDSSVNYFRIQDSLACSDTSWSLGWHSGLQNGLGINYTNRTSKTQNIIFVVRSSGDLTAGRLRLFLEYIISDSALTLGTDNALKIKGKTSILDTTSSTSPTTGALTVAGGIGITGQSTTSNKIKFSDSTKTPTIKDAAGKFWRIKISTTGVITADSTGQN